MTPSPTTDLQNQCDLLRSLHRPGAPLLLPNAWDVATARAVVAAGFPVVATTSAGVAATLGYADHEAPADEMVAAAARIATSVEVPVTVDAEAGYGMEPAELVTALRSAGAAGCNLEDTDHTAGCLRDPERHAEWLKGHLPGAIFVPLLDLDSGIRSIDPSKRSLVYCREGYRATTATSILLRQSSGDFGILIDGFDGWSALGLPLQVPSTK